MTVHFGDSSSIATGKIVNSAYIVDRKNQSTDGGTATGGGHYQRDLNTIVFDSGMSISVSSNQFTIPNAGTYCIHWSCPAYNVDHHASRLNDVTNSTDKGEGHNEYMNAYGSNRSEGAVRVTITGSTTYKLMHRVTSTKSSNGFGVQSNGNANHDQYSWVKIYQEA
jgi:hypothetical protein